MNTVSSIALVFVIVSVPSMASAQEKSWIDKVVDSVRRVCLAPGEPGKEWMVEVDGKGNVTIGIKLAGQGKLEGQAKFSKREWEGVQQVLREKQADDNARYRECAEKLTPMFLEKFGPEKKVEGQPRMFEARWQPTFPVATSQKLTELKKIQCPCLLLLESPPKKMPRRGWPLYFVFENTCKGDVGVLVMKDTSSLPPQALGPMTHIYEKEGRLFAYMKLAPGNKGRFDLTGAHGGLALPVFCSF